ncbi:hypothetical protein ACLB2K_042838 [Fragaria x ananassa]
MIPDMIASAETMLDRWKGHEEGKEMEVYEEFRLLTSEVISRTAFGSSYAEGKNIFDMLMKLSLLLKNDFKLKFISNLFKTNDDIESEKLEKGTRDSIMGIVKKREEKAMILLLALRTDWQEEARKEVLQLFGKHTPNPDGLAKLKTMSMIFNESLRLYSPAVTVTRRVEKDVRLGNLIVPATTELIIPYLALHHEPESWGQDVQHFKPE